MAEAKKAKLDQARQWLETAIAGGYDPIMYLEGEDDGTICTGRGDLEARKTHRPGRCPMELWDELYELMLPLGRVQRLVSQKEVVNG